LLGDGPTSANNLYLLTPDPASVAGPLKILDDSIRISASHVFLKSEMFALKIER
jgi:hypothetical protein